MNEAKKIFLVQVGEHAESSEWGWDAEDLAKNPDGLFWATRGGATDSFPEAEARAILMAKTFKNVRIVSQETEIIGHVE